MAIRANRPLAACPLGASTVNRRTGRPPGWAEQETAGVNQQNHRLPLFPELAGYPAPDRVEGYPGPFCRRVRGKFRDNRAGSPVEVIRTRDGPYGRPVRTYPLRGKPRRGRQSPDRDSPPPCSAFGVPREFRKKWEPADKPGSVVDNHSSGTAVTDSLMQPTRKHRGPRHCFPIWSCSRWGLPCRSVLPPARCALTAPFHPYPGSGLRRCGAVSFLLHFP